MNDEQFDSWTRRLARGGSRRQALRLMASSALGLAFVGKVRPAKADDLPAYLHPLLEDDESYIPDSDPNLKNPERGMYFASRPNTPQEFHTIVPGWLWLAPVCGVDLVWNGYNQSGTSPALNDYARDFLEPARTGGYKILFRPRYDKEDDCNGDPSPCPSDCTFEGGSAEVFHADSRDRQKRHITAIANMLGDYKDVIAFIQAGYLGRWGEWNWAEYGPDNAPLLDNVSYRQEIIDWVIGEYDRVGIKQHVELRRPIFAKQVLERPGMAGARVGFHNDCFMTDPTDYSTYGNFRSQEPSNFMGATDEVWAAAKLWAQQTLTPTASFGGETCPIDADPKDEFSDGTERWQVCDDMISPTGDPATLHMTYLNGDFVGDKCRPSGKPGGQCLPGDVIVPGAVTTWRNGGCYDEIRRRLGYRFEIRSVEHTPTVAAGQPLQVRVDIENTGWARLHKPREAKLVLRGGSPPSHAYTDPSGAGAVANWAPGQTITLSFNEVVPDPGMYSVRLWIPDPDDPTNSNQDPDVKGLIDYAVKLATLRDNGTNVFDLDTGDNDLGVTITVQ